VNAFYNLGKLIYFRFRDDRGVQVAGSLTFTTVLALVPLLTVALIIFSSFPVFDDITIKIKIFLLMNLVPVQAGKIITVYMQQFADNATGLTALGIIVLFLTAIAQLHTIENSFNSIWRVRRERSILQRIIIYWAMLTFVPVLIGASLWLSSWLMSFSLGWVELQSFASVAVLKGLPFVLTAIAFALLYFTVPNRRIEKRDALLGGIIAAIVFEAMKRGFGWYVAHVPTYSLVYGAFASIPIFLMWIYLSWLVTIFGATITAVLPSWRDGRWKIESTIGRKFYNALWILKLFFESNKSGTAVSSTQLRTTLKISAEDIDEIIEQLLGAGWISRSTNSSWTLSRDSEKIVVADVFQLFISLPDAEQQAPTLKAQLTDLNNRLQGQMQTTLKDFFDNQKIADQTV
jgi:membrane protein